jgi:hypothetical protein
LAGRLAEILKDLNANQTVPMNISLDGSNVWQTGITGAEYAIRPDGAVALTGTIQPSTTPITNVSARR